MGDSSKKHVKFLSLTLAAILFLSIGVNLLMRFADLASTGSMRSGVFNNTSQGIDSDGWHFYADEANGNSTFFTSLSQSDLDNVLLVSRRLSGKMLLSITQGNIHRTFDLSKNEVEMTAKEMDMHMLEPGRVEMRLYFIYAENIDVTVNWQGGTDR